MAVFPDPTGKMIARVFYIPPHRLYFDDSVSMKYKWQTQWQRDGANEDHYGKKYNMHVHSTDTTLLKLIQTCKQAYLEALPLLYGDMEFFFSNISHLNALLDLVGPNGRASIKLLSQLDEDDRLFKLNRCAHGLTNLKTLCILMHHSHYKFIRTGDGMHPVSILRGLVLEVYQQPYPEDHWISDWYKEHKSQCEAFAARMIAHVAQLRGT